uniref:Uncharacterized protein n=1 Tax=Arundo donax TaxID=35708 RepID=A0A0A9ATU1_ARUDO
MFHTSVCAHHATFFWLLSCGANSLMACYVLICIVVQPFKVCQNSSITVLN